MLMLAGGRGGPGDDRVSWALVGPVAVAVHDDLVGGVDEPVEQGLGDDGVREQRVPVCRSTCGLSFGRNALAGSTSTP